MKNKNKIIFILIILVFFLFFGFLIFKNDYSFFKKEEPFVEKNINDNPLLNKEEQIIVASCPTFYYMLEKLEGLENVKTMKTLSTNESLQMLKLNSADLVISGRPLKINEPNFLSQKIGYGYDFISSDEFLILEREMIRVPFFTDISSRDIINDFEYITENNIEEVENITDYLDKGIIITKIEGKTDAKFVYIIKENGSRVRLSRIPRLYYSPNFKEENLNIIKEIIKEN